MHHSARPPEISLDFVTFLYKQITKIDYQSVIKFLGNLGWRIVRHLANGKENSHWQASAPNGAIVLSQWGRLTSKLAGNPIASEQHHRCEPVTDKNRFA